MSPKTNIRPPGHILALKPYVPGKPIEELKRELGLRSIIKLASNENPYGMSSKACEAAKEVLQKSSRYPEGSGFVLKKALAEHLSVSPETLVLGNGSNEVLELIARTFVMPNDEVIFWQYAFAVYPLLVQAVSAKAVIIPIHNWAYDLTPALSAITPKTRLIFIANPNNPTGYALSGKALLSFIKAVPSHIPIVIDEAYHEYQIQKDYQTALPWIQKNPNLIVTRTFSKAYGLAGFRVGYSVSDGKIAGFLNCIRQPFNVNTVAQAAALAALEDQTFVQDSVEKNTQERDAVCKALESLKLSFIPSTANFVAIDFKQPAYPIYQALLREGVIVRPLQNYAMPHHLRVTIGSRKENDRFIKALKKILLGPVTK
ncbi:MAG: histidinol-phosphate transaminase [Gammaproteobacteria bacterium]|nr:histidinol-phosphate transaminase [Gammaproteobacteria bacterium]